ncbi:ABC transporter substrate-binding protein [Turicimonas muris]|uniref:ABC transporter substrate-binding protein n=6 Tax=Turicimonas muris TaxID=1796652 RepID=UPI0023F3A660|nr:NrtA/SsuA/CpmA family ABC transporter substrate-binding protein [Turicimonas muris]MBS4768960.1 NrtA/SsuA/CpmA family ABC transporter substrate-binding protein [Burkholderiales bacterium]
MFRTSLSVLFAGLFSASLCFAADLPKEINIVYVKAPFNLQNIVMKEKGMLEKAFEKDNIKINWKTITSGSKQTQAMAGKSIDISAVMNTSSLLMANGVGNKILIATGVSHPADTFAIVGKPEAIQSIKDLKGKKIVGPKGTVLHQLLVAALNKEGMSIKDVEFISMDQPTALAALLAGRVDAALLAASGVIKAEKSGSKVITTAKDLVNVNLVTTVTEDFAKKYPEVLDTVVKVQREALDWIKKNPEEAIGLGAKEHGIDMDDARKLASWSNYYNTLSEKDIEGLQKDQDFLFDNKMMEKKVDVKSLVLPSALK